jgi:hypothetical protein
VPQKNKGVSQQNQNKNFVKKRITKYFGVSDPVNELMHTKNGIHQTIICFVLIDKIMQHSHPK